MRNEYLKEYNRSLLETYHISNVFDSLLEDIVQLIRLLCNTFKVNLEYYVKQYNNKCKFTGYDYIDKDNSVIKCSDINECRCPIYLKIVVGDGYKFAISRKINKRLYIECNILTLVNLYITQSPWNFRTSVRAWIKHEFLHVYQLLKDSLFDIKTFDKLDIIKKYLDNPEDLSIELTDEQKSNIISLFKYALKTELDACLNGVSEKLSSYSKEEILQYVKKTYDDYDKISDNVIKACSDLVKDESKLGYILTILSYVKEHKLIHVMEHINKYVHIYKGDIEDYFKKYEITILNQIYYVLDNIIEYNKSELSELLRNPLFNKVHFYSIFD